MSAKRACHVITHLKEHKRSGPVGNHFKGCGVQISMDSLSILCITMYYITLNTSFNGPRGIND